jgi:hypothetical protein
MATENDTLKNIRFFSNSSLVKQEQVVKQEQDPTPFGLNLKEPFPENKQTAIHQTPTVGHQCPTHTLTNPDSSIDVDVNF